MPRNYIRKTNRANNKDSLEHALADVNMGSSVRQAAKTHGVDRITLTRFIDRKQKGEEPGVAYSGTRQAKMVFTDNMEKELAAHIIALADSFYGLSKDKTLEMAYEFAIQNHVTVPPSWIQNKRAGNDWFRAFRNRHKLSIRSPEATSIARATGFNKPAVDSFYDKLADLMDRYHFEPQDIYNMDESGLTTAQTPKRVIALTGQKQIGSITSQERGELVTFVGTVSASGVSIPPLFIFPRAKYYEHFISGAPTGSIGCAGKSGSGWMTGSIFSSIYLPHFVKHAKCSPSKPVLMILDNHESHISVEALTYAKASGIHMLTLPPHCSHKLQPLDRSIYGPLKIYYNKSMDAYMRSNVGKGVNIYNIPAITEPAYHKAMTIDNITAGFRSTGIFPYNRDTFQECDFAAAQVSERALPEPNAPDLTSVAASTSAASETTAVSAQSPAGNSATYSLSGPSTL